MLQLKNKHWEVIKQILSKYPYKFYAYGSRTKNQAREYSDLDFCYQEEIPWNILSHLGEDFEQSDLPFKVDLVYWGWMSSEFREMIKNDLMLVA